MNDPSSPSVPNGAQQNSHPVRREKGIWKSLVDLFSGRASETARDALEELIEIDEQGDPSLGADERALLGNVLELSGQTIADVMVPRADIHAIDAKAKLEQFIDLMIREGHSRFPVYRGSLDSVIGMVHVKDVLANTTGKDTFNPAAIARPVMFVSPAMQVLELLLEMRQKRCHMALVVDEFGGVDGLVTIEDLVEEIVGEIEDEFDAHEQFTIEPRDDGSWDANARILIEDFEKALGRSYFTETERAEVDTLGGLVFSISGRVPIRGELLEHSSGLEFEILEADPRRIKRLRIHLPVRDETETENDDDEGTDQGDRSGNGIKSA
ncbi:MAG: HlyC/CorC family transporter [Rhodospirillaceae bacterium]|nr:HlyC/CorC family transporter [Rhodospirillaceae bacterium]